MTPVLYSRAAFPRARAPLFIVSSYGCPYMSPKTGRSFNWQDRRQLCHLTVERDRSSLFGSFLKLASESTASWSGSKELMFPTWHCLSLPMRIIFASAQMVWLDCSGAGCNYGLAQSEVKIWQSSSLFDLRRQLKESTSGFKVQKGCLHRSDKASCCQVSCVLPEHRQPLFIVGSEAAGVVSHTGATEFHCCLQGCPWQKGVVGEVFSLSQPLCSLCLPFLSIML